MLVRVERIWYRATEGASQRERKENPPRGQPLTIPLVGRRKCVKDLLPAATRHLEKAVP